MEFSNLENLELFIIELLTSLNITRLPLFFKRTTPTSAIFLDFVCTNLDFDILEIKAIYGLASQVKFTTSVLHIKKPILPKYDSKKLGKSLIRTWEWKKNIQTFKAH